MRMRVCLPLLRRRVLAIQSQSKDADVQKRVLQTMVMVVTWKSCDMTEDTVAQVSN